MITKIIHFKSVQGGQTCLTTEPFLQFVTRVLNDTKMQSISQNGVILISPQLDILCASAVKRYYTKNDNSPFMSHLCCHGQTLEPFHSVVFSVVMVLTCLPISCQLYGHVMLCTSCVDINDISHVLFIYLVLKLYTSTNCENTALVQSMLMSIRCVRSSALQLCTVWYGFYRWPFVCTQQVQSFRQVVWPSAAHALSHVLLYRTA